MKTKSGKKKINSESYPFIHISPPTTLSPSLPSSSFFYLFLPTSLFQYLFISLSLSLSPSISLPPPPFSPYISLSIPLPPFLSLFLRPSPSLNILDRVFPLSAHGILHLMSLELLLSSTPFFTLLPTSPPLRFSLSYTPHHIQKLSRAVLRVHPSGPWP